MEILDNLDGHDGGQNIRQDEINGKQHKFHSFPKEFQAWHNTQYMLEKKATIDESTISESALNGMMWQAIGDGVKFGITSFIAIAFAIIKLKISPNTAGLIVSLIVFIPWVTYSVYHFVFYSKIRAQVVGPLSGNGFKYTAKTFYETYFGIIISLCIALIFVFSILGDIVLLLRDSIVGLSPKGILDGYLKVVLTGMHNFFVELLTPPKDLYGSFLFNTYSSTFIFLGSLIGATYLFENLSYTRRRVIVDKEIIQEKNLTGYPIDNALTKLHDWRSKNGV